MTRTHTIAAEQYKMAKCQQTKKKEKKNAKIARHCEILMFEAVAFLASAA